MKPRRILIVGGGFGGISTALELAKENLSDTKITLISDRPHFEYHATLYRVLTGHSPLEVCIPLQDIFEGKSIEVVQDRIIGVDLENKKVSSEYSEYQYDYLVLALGGQTNYYGAKGLKEHAYTISSISSVLKLKNHTHLLFDQCKNLENDEKLKNMHFIIVGGGVTGCEVAGELAIYLKKLAQQHQVDSSLITIDLIQAASRLVPMLPEEASEEVTYRLKQLGVNIYLNRTVLKEDVEQVYMKDMKIKTKTVIWSAGIQINDLYKNIDGLQIDKKGRVKVDEHLNAKGFNNVFIIGDAAGTKNTGMAQTALYDGEFAAKTIYRMEKGLKLIPYISKKPNFAIPIGPKWAAAIVGGYSVYGYIGWIFRKFTDLYFFLRILPFQKAIRAFRSDKSLCEACPTCSELS